jgi:hypothetical protein
VFGNTLFNFIKTAEAAAAKSVKWIEEISAENTLSDDELEDVIGEASKNIKLRV